MSYRERGYHARGVYPTQDTSRMGTARVKQERYILKEWYEIYKNGRWALYDGKVPNKASLAIETIL